MLTRIQTRNYKNLRAINQRLEPFYALVGPNASGKTSFLDAIGFFNDLLKNQGDVQAAVHARSPLFENLVWRGKGNSFQLAVEAKIPGALIQTPSSIRYEIEIGADASGLIGLNNETLLIFHQNKNPPAQEAQPDFFPSPQKEAPSILATSKNTQNILLKKEPGGNAVYSHEGQLSLKIKTGRQKSALANWPSNKLACPVALWFREYLQNGVQQLGLNNQKIRNPSPPGLVRNLLPDGSNLPWMVAELKKTPNAFASWLQHVRTALADIEDISTVERPEDKHCYLRIHYKNGAPVPSWLVSDGTLRLLALTIPAYLPGFNGVFLIKNPETGIHPSALETVFQSLSSIYSGQVLLATHSPSALGLLTPRQILCFAKDANGATAIISGDRHPALREWKAGELDLEVLFASGILS